MRRFPLTLRGVGALAVGAALCLAAYLIGSPEALLFGVMFLALVVCCLLVLWLRRGVDSVVRTLRPETVAVGEQAVVALRIASASGPPPAGGEWNDALPAGLTGEAGGFLDAAARADRADRDRVISYSVTGMRRGVQRIGPLSLVEHDPFRIARRARTIGGRTSVAVTPSIVPLLPLAQVAADSGLTVSSTLRSGQGSDNLIPRPYAPGDSMRRVHWRASARLDELMVREEEQEASPQAVVVFDRDATRWGRGAAEPGGDEAFEDAVSLCVSAAWRLWRDGHIVDVLDGTGTGLASLGGQGHAQSDERDALLRAFTTIGARGTAPIATIGDRLDSALTGTLVLITGRVDREDGDALRALARRGRLPLLFAAAPAAGALTDARGDGWLAGPITSDAAACWADAVGGHGHPQGSERADG